MFRKISTLTLCAFFFCFSASLVQADNKLLATSGATQIEGSAGGGIVPWALIAGYGSDGGEWGGAVSLTRVSVDDFELDSMALVAGINNRVELSYARQDLEVAPLGLHIKQDIFGAKVRLMGDVVYNRLPQISLGAQYKKNKDAAVPFAVGAQDDSGVDVYASATKLYLAALFGRNLLVNGTLRATEANQAGLLGFGSQTDVGYDWVAEASLGLFINRHWAVGLEYRQKPDKLAAVKEDDWADVFIAWFPNKRVAVVAAYSDLGDIAGLTNQTGWYLSLQVTQ